MESVEPSEIAVNETVSVNQAIPVSDDEDDEDRQENRENDSALGSCTKSPQTNGKVPPENGLVGEVKSINDQYQPQQEEIEPDIAGSDVSNDEQDVVQEVVGAQVLAVEVALEQEPDNISDAGNSPPLVDQQPPPQKNEIDEISIAHEMNHYMKVNSINWLELSNREDMWAVCDAISAAHSGLPDSLLKEALLFLLQNHLNRTPKSKHNMSHLRRHLEEIMRIWNVEVQMEKAASRPTKFVAASAAYSPPVMKRRRGNAQRKRAIKNLMGVGEMLQQAQLRFATEEGELDVDEDEHGNISIGGQELSFEHWAQLNKIKNADIVHSSVVPPRQKRPRPQPVPKDEEDEDIPQLTTVEEPKKPKSPKPEKDEGEISESESSSCSSSSSEDGESAMARGRRRKRRNKERAKAPTSVANMNSMFGKFYQFRFQIAQTLSLQQKATFLDLIKQSNGGISAARQQQQMMQFMSSFLGSSQTPK